MQNTVEFWVKTCTACGCHNMCQSWFSCYLPEKKFWDSTNTSFPLAWSQDTAWDAHFSCRIALPALEFTHPWKSQLVKSESVKERCWLSFSDVVTYVFIKDQIPAALTLRLSPSTTADTSSGPGLVIWIKLCKEPQKSWQGNFLGMSW